MSAIYDYEADFYAWTYEQAAKLRTGQFTELDLANIAEELEGLGKSQKKELISRLTVLLAHLLKWQYQPPRRCTSWEITIEEQRYQLQKHLQENPSLNAKLPDAIADAYQSAVRWARDETGLKKEIFPTDCPYSWVQISDNDFYPEVQQP
jgi:hypothetical protein